MRRVERVDDRATAALRTGTREGLVAALAHEAERNAGFHDYRDVLLSFAPFYDAAKSLGLDTTDVFNAAAATVPEDVASCSASSAAVPTSPSVSLVGSGTAPRTALRCAGVAGQNE